MLKEGDKVYFIKQIWNSPILPYNKKLTIVHIYNLDTLGNVISGRSLSSTIVRILEYDYYDYYIDQFLSLKDYRKEKLKNIEINECLG